jgi:hypothetical protein
MKLNAYTIFDVASGVHMRPFFSQADGQAVRGFKDIATDAEHEVGKHPEDYTLYRIGSFNDQTGKIEGEEPEKLISGLQCVSMDRNPNQRELISAIEEQTNGAD